MRIYFVFILIALILLSCNKGINQNQEVNKQKNDNSKSNITEFKINTVVNKNKKKRIVVDGKELVEPEKLFDYFPKKFKNIDLLEESSGKSTSELGVFTTSTGTFEKDRNYISIRLSDYMSDKYFPEIEYIKNTPKDDNTFTFKKIVIADGINGYLQWHKFEDYGIINIFAYNRFNIYLEIVGFPELKQNYKSFIKRFDLNKLKEISISK